MSKPVGGAAAKRRALPGLVGVEPAANQTQYATHQLLLGLAQTVGIFCILLGGFFLGIIVAMYNASFFAHFISVIKPATFASLRQSLAYFYVVMENLYPWSLVEVYLFFVMPFVLIGALLFKAGVTYNEQTKASTRS